MNGPFVITVAPNGARRGYREHPAMPLTVEEIARAAARCRDAGAAMIHLHVRDAKGEHLLDADAYREATAAIRAQVGDDLIVQITTEAVEKYQPAEQIAVVKAVRPEAASVALRELAPDEDALGDAEAFYHWMAAERVLAQHILYTPEEVRRFNDLRARGVIPGDKPLVLFVLGTYAGGPGDIRLLPSYLAALREGGEAHWGVCAFGVTEAPAARWAMANGGHPRVGFENNLMLEDGGRAANNAELVAQTVRDAQSDGRTIATAQDARELFSGDRGTEAPRQTWNRHGAVGA